MKKFIISMFVVFLSIVGVSAQTISFNEVSTATERPKGEFKEYVSKDGSVYKVGEQLTIGSPSTNKTFAFVILSDGFSTVVPMGVGASNSKTEIIKFKIGGNKRMGFSITAITKSPNSLFRYYIQLENGIEEGEIKSFGFSSDEALTELKKCKDKLDLGLITQEEFDNKKIELSKFIK